MVGSNESLECFDVREKTGVIVLKRSLLLEPCVNESYSVSQQLPYQYLFY